MNTMNVMIAHVKTFALNHYDTNGWDLIVETYSDEEIAEAIGDARTWLQAIRNVRDHIAPMADYRADIQAEAF